MNTRRNFPFLYLSSGVRTVKLGALPTFMAILLLSGCTSGFLHEGAYVGTGNTYETQGRSEVRRTSSTPLFAPRDVKDDARNRGAMEKYTGRPVEARPVTVNDVIAWKQSGVREENVITHIRIHGLYKPLQGQDVLTLQNHSVSPEVIRAMKEHPYPNVDAPTPAPRSRGTSFTRNSRNPDTNPGNGDFASGNTGSNPYTSTSRPAVTAPPVSSTSPRKPRFQQANPSPSYGTSVEGSGVYSNSGVIIEEECPVLLEDGVYYEY